MKILLIEDEKSVAEFIIKGLSENNHVVDHQIDGKDGLFMATTETYDMMVIDRMLPTVDGLTIIRTLRASKINTPVLILSAMADVEQRVEGLQNGADDYLVKPFSFSELLARVEVLGRRNTSNDTQITQLQVSDLKIDLLTHQSALIYDHNKKELVLFCEDLDKIDEYCKKIQTDLLKIRDLQSNFDLDESPDVIQDPEKNYLKAVDKIKQYIVDGDVFQVNLSRLWQMNSKSKQHNELACYLYRQLRTTNPAPFSALVNLLGNSILSSSPERLVKVKNNIVESRPIAGTRPRGKTFELDELLKEQLHAHPKEQSEHVMLIDLIRNDLGRVCVPGSIHVDEFMVNETYQHVHHIVSNVVGKNSSKLIFWNTHFFIQ